MKVAREVWLTVAAGCVAMLSLMPSGQAFTDKDANDLFKMFDSNGDGKVTREEYEINKVSIIYRRVPTNPIAGVTFSQTKVSRQFFDSADKNHDGKLSPQEIVDALPFEGVAPAKQDYFEIGDFRPFLKSIGP